MVVELRNLAFLLVQELVPVLVELLVECLILPTLGRFPPNVELLKFLVCSIIKCNTIFSIYFLDEFSYFIIVGSGFG